MRPRSDGSRPTSADRSAPRPRTRRAAWVALLSVAGAASVLLALGAPSPAPTSSSAGGDAASRPFEPAAQASTLAARAGDPRFREAADAMGHHDCARAQASLAPALSADDPDLGGTARLLSGLYAHACEDVTLAAERLREPAPGGLLDDWRLLLFAEAAHAIGHPEEADGADEADRALATLIERHAASPLVERAFVTAVEQAAESGRPERALEWVTRSRARRELSAETVGRIESLAWEIAVERLDHSAQAEAGRRLLAYAPERADELSVLDLFYPRQPPGPRGAPDVAWRALLDPPDLLRRAGSLLDLGRSTEAFAALEDVRTGERGFDWRLLAARALTAERRADEALTLLAGIETNQPERQARLAWERARAAKDLSSPLRSGARLPAAERHRMVEVAHDQWHRLVAAAIRSRNSSPLALAALRRLFADYVDDERFDEAIEALRMLRRLDPGDTTGASYLWSKGWEEYRRRNDTGAIGYWSELLSLYDDSAAARSGRYWTGRAFERLGNRERAVSILREVAAVGSTDFYRKHALAHLDRLGASEPAAAGALPDPPGRQPWPEEPTLARARTLTDLGVHGLALAEIEGLVRTTDRASVDGPSIDPRAVEALTGLSLARMGKRRASIPHLRRAFPVLGGPNQQAAPAEVQRLYYPLDFGPAIETAARESGVPQHLVLGMIREESAFDVSALSHVGARGLMQLMPATGREVARTLGLPYSSARLDDPAYNVRLGSAYFARVLSMFGGNTELALAGYNGGPYRLKRLWRRAGPGTEIDFFTEALPLDESRGYVKRVILFANSYQELYGI